MNKRGEMSSFQIVGLVITIVGFVILLLFIPVINDIYGKGGETDRELCHLSVLTRATSPDALQAQVPLRCTTEKVCISESGKKDACRQFAGEENIRAVKINLDKPEEGAKIIERESADAMLDCWQTMGEGKLDLWNRATDFSENTPKCVVCSRLAIDLTLWNNDKFKTDVLPLVDVNEFMEKERPTERIAETYLQLFTDVGVKSAPSFDSLSEKEREDVEKANEELDNSGKNSGSYTGQMAVVFAQIKTDDISEAVLNTLSGGFVLYGSSVLTPVGRLTATPVGAIGSAVLIGGASVFAGIETAQGRAIAGGYCGDFTTTDEKAKEGCSIVQFTNWEASNINSACTGGIEGNL